MNESIQISDRELRALLNNEDTADSALEEYFVLDTSNPFAPSYSLKPGIEVTKDDIDAFGVGAPLLVVANGLTRRKRLAKYRSIIKKFPDRVRIVAEGDSWFQHPKIDDAIDHLFNHYGVYSIGAAGDHLRDMFAENEFLPSLRAQRSNILLLSGGGNDLLGDFGKYLNAYSAGKDPNRLLNANFHKKLSDLMNIYSAVFNSTMKNSPETQVFVHGYDFVVPVSGKRGKWLGRPMTKKGLLDEGERRELMKHVINLFSDSLRDLTKKHRNSVFIDVRGVVGEDQWYDEIHPDSNGFQQVSLKFLERIN